MPKNAVVMHSDANESGLFVWALVDIKAETENRYFGLFQTGQKLPDSIADCILIKTFVTRLLTKAPVVPGDMPEFKTCVDHLWEVSAKTVKELREIHNQTN